jgi:hypothetical protein
MHLKSGRRAENDAYARKRTTSRVMVASKPKVNFPVLEIMDDSLYNQRILNFPLALVIINVLLNVKSSQQ